MSTCLQHAHCLSWKCMSAPNLTHFGRVQLKALHLLLWFQIVLFTLSKMHQRRYDGEEVENDYLTEQKSARKMFCGFYSRFFGWLHFIKWKIKENKKDFKRSNLLNAEIGKEWHKYFSLSRIGRQFLRYRRLYFRRTKPYGLVYKWKIVSENIKSWHTSHFIA